MQAKRRSCPSTPAHRRSCVVEYGTPKPDRLVSYGVEKGDQIDGMTVALNDGPTLKFAKQRKRKIGAANTWGLSQKRLVIRVPAGSDPTTPWLTLPAATLAEWSLNVDPVIYTLRQDHIGAYGYARLTTPNIDAFAQTSVIFDPAGAPAPGTLPSSPAALDGRTPDHVSGQAHLAELLGRTGWASCAVISNNWLISTDTLGSGWPRHWAKPQSPARKNAKRRGKLQLQGYAHEEATVFISWDLYRFKRN